MSALRLSRLPRAFTDFFSGLFGKCQVNKQFPLSASQTMNIKKLFVAFCLAAASLSSMADTNIDSFGTCLTDNTTGKDRKELARWVFMAMASHPDIRDLSHITPDTHEDIDKTMAALLMKLVTDTCAKQARLAATNGGAESFRAAFEILGKVAMQEIMSNAEVNKSIAGFQRYVDKKKLRSTLTEK